MPGPGQMRRPRRELPSGGWCRDRLDAADDAGPLVRPVPRRWRWVHRRGPRILDSLRLLIAERSSPKPARGRSLSHFQRSWPYPYGAAIARHRWIRGRV